MAAEGRIQERALVAPVVGWPLAFGIGLLPVAAVLGWLVANQPELYRLLFAIVITTVLGLCALRWPRGAILGTLLFLPLLGLIRRLLIGPSGWPDADPLLLIGPALALILFAKAYLLDSHRLLPDLLSKLVLGLAGLALLGVFNPSGGGVAAGAAALMFTGVPLLWFFVGRALPDRRTIAQLQDVSVFLAAAIALYGLGQTEIGFPAWDLAWIDIVVGGYTSLHVGNVVRAFGTMASSAEYAFYLGVGVALAAAALLHRRGWPLVLLPILVVGLLLSSVRTVVVTGVLALLAMAAVQSRRPRLALPVLLAATVLAYTTLTPVLLTLSSESGSSLVSHQLEGLARPFDENFSTGPVHLELITQGLTEGVRTPLGHGTAVTTLAAGSFGDEAGVSTEFDFSNAFVSLGLPGGLLYIAIVAVTLSIIARRYMGARDPVLLGVLGVAIVTLGFWLLGAHYAIAPLLWTMLGWGTRPPDEPRPRPGGGMTRPGGANAEV